jgi:hypothetical protein
MKKPEDNKANLDKCICEQCGIFLTRVCPKDMGDEKTKLYCARTISKCKMGEGVCICPGCEIYTENGLSGYTFCQEEIEEK